MAVINAIDNACGVRIYELPAYPEKIKEGLDKLARGEEILPPKKYFLGSDFYEEMEYIKNNPMTDLFEDMFPEDKKGKLPADYGYSGLNQPRGMTQVGFRMG